MLTQSRTSIALLVLPAALMAFRLSARDIGGSASVSGQSRYRSRAAIVTLVLLAGLAAGILSSQVLKTTRIETSLARFSVLEDDRPEMWEDALVSAERFWPVGAGIGSFDEVFQIDESLEYVSQRRAGHAHNDYIELAIEAGAPGLALAAIWLAWCAIATLRAVGLPERWPERWPALAASGIVAAVALQSATDYPLRNQTMLCLAALAIVFLARARQDARARTA